MNSCFIVFENKYARDECLESFEKAKRSAPCWTKLTSYFSGKLDYGPNTQSDLHNKVFLRKYIPLEVRSVPKPEFMLWENLDFVKRKMTVWEKLSGYRALLAVNLVNMALAFATAG